MILQRLRCSLRPENQAKSQELIAKSCFDLSVILPRGTHPFPSRTRKLSPAGPMVLHAPSVWERRSLPALIKASLRNQIGLFLLGWVFYVVPETAITLYRPVGRAELDLIRGSGFARFPPRLPEQPIFYPVLSETYAIQIARDWNTKDERSGFVGYVLRFKVNSSFLDNYEVRTVGSSEHREYWIPAADLGRFNENIIGEIEVISQFRRD
jgi:hypothetical protein